MTDEDPQTGPRVVLNADGRLEGRLDKVEPPRPVDAAPQLDENAPLELQERQPTAPLRMYEPNIFTPKTPFFKHTIVRVLLVLMVVALVIGASAWWLVRPRELPIGVTDSKPMQMANTVLGVRKVPAIIVSEPSGAAIMVGSTQIGVTPWAGDNEWGDSKVELRMPGYKTWVGLLSKGETHLSVTLVRKP